MRSVLTGSSAEASAPRSGILACSSALHSSSAAIPGVPLEDALKGWLLSCKLSPASDPAVPAIPSPPCASIASRSAACDAL